MEGLTHDTNKSCGSGEFNEGMINMRAFAHIYKNVKCDADMWVMGDKIVIVHHPTNESARGKKIHTRNYSPTGRVSFNNTI